MPEEREEPARMREREEPARMREPEEPARMREPVERVRMPEPVEPWIREMQPEIRTLEMRMERQATESKNGIIRTES